MHSASVKWISQNEVARTLNVNQSTISRLWNRFQQTGSTNDRQRSGGPYSWVRSVHPGLSSTESTRCRINHCSQNTCIEKNQLTKVRNRLRQHGIRPKRPYFGAVLTPLHRHGRERVHWCNRLRGWTFQKWRRIWFSDESRFLLQKRDGRIREGAGMNVSLPPVFRKWKASVEVVSWCGRPSQMTANQT